MNLMEEKTKEVVGSEKKDTSSCCSKPCRCGWCVVLVLVLLAGAVYAGILIEKNEILDRFGNLETPPTELEDLDLDRETPPEVLNESTITPTQSTTTNWQTYKNSQYGFVFMYPNDWEFSPGINILLTKRDTTQKPVEISPDSLQIPDYYITVFAPSSDSIPQKAKLDTIIIGGEKAYKLQESGSPSSGFNTMFFVKHNGNLFEFSYGAMAYPETHQKFYDTYLQILSTFKFLD